MCPSDCFPANSSGRRKPPSPCRTTLSQFRSYFVASSIPIVREKDYSLALSARLVEWNPPTRSTFFPVFSSNSPDRERNVVKSAPDIRVPFRLPLPLPLNSFLLTGKRVRNNHQQKLSWTPCPNILKWPGRATRSIPAC